MVYEVPSEFLLNTERKNRYINTQKIDKSMLTFQLWVKANAFRILLLVAVFNMNSFGTP